MTQLTPKLMRRARGTSELSLNQDFSRVLCPDERGFSPENLLQYWPTISLWSKRDKWGKRVDNNLLLRSAVSVLPTRFQATSITSTSGSFFRSRVRTSEATNTMGIWRAFKNLRLTHHTQTWQGVHVHQCMSTTYSWKISQFGHKQKTSLQ